MRIITNFEIFRIDIPLRYLSFYYYLIAPKLKKIKKTTGYPRNINTRCKTEI